MRKSPRQWLKYLQRVPLWVATKLHAALEWLDNENNAIRTVNPFIQFQPY